MSESVRRHYQLYPYPNYSLAASVRRCDTYAAHLSALWSRFNGELPPPPARAMLIAGCGSFAPYPFALANPGIPVTALDLSRQSLSRARLHCWLHGLTRVRFLEGDLCDPAVAPGPFGFIDAYGVLHHLADPLAGLRTLAGRLREGGIIRVMVYSRYARREEESIRRALRLLRVSEPEQVQAMVKRSREGSRLRNFFASSDEVGFRAGLADALLHPCVRTFRIDSFMEMVSRSGLTPLLFAHRLALPGVADEVERIRRLEAERTSPGNFVLYLGRGVRGPAPDQGAVFSVNPCLSQALSLWRLGPFPIPGRLGHDLEPLDRRERRFLRRFLKPVRAADLSPEDLARANRYSDELLLMRYRE